MGRAGNTGLGWADVTPQDLWLRRRQVVAGMAGLGGLALAGGAAAATPVIARPSPYSTAAPPDSFETITTHNNFYEFGFGKGDPAARAGRLTIDPWAVQIDGLVERPGSYDLGDILAMAPLEERIYRLRCVEAWSLVIPWIGLPLAAVLDRVGVRPGAKYVAFTSVARPDEMSGVKAGLLDWPYREGLRLDEAMHPLTLLATGLYGQELPHQNGAPIRVVVPWKYGFKSAKSIVRITLTADQPPTTWQMAQPREYGFFANVNPEVDHPRWSQASERPIGGGVFAKRVDTVKFNGYGELVADLYAGQDLAVDY